MVYYTTKLIVCNGTLRAFYLYRGLGYVPCEIAFKWRGRAYGTIEIMGLLAKKESKIKVKAYDYTLKVADWYDEGGKFNKALFIQLTRNLLMG